MASSCLRCAPAGMLCVVFFTFLSSVRLAEGGRGLALPKGNETNKTLPFVLLHGIGDECDRPGMVQFMTILEEMSGANGTCVEIGDGATDSWIMRMEYQSEIACEKIKALPGLEGGFNLLGLSQGALIGRAYIEFCEDSPPVNNFISLGGPHAGVASTPLCELPLICKFIDAIISLGVYTPYVQDHIAPTGYVKIPTDLSAYYSGCVFLPNLNNELPASRNASLKDRFSAINFLQLIKFDMDTVVFPRESSHFGFYPEGRFDSVVPAEETTLYIEDWIGLRALAEGGKVGFITVPGNHLHVSRQMIMDYVVPLLVPPGNVSLSHTGSGRWNREGEHAPDEILFEPPPRHFLPPWIRAGKAN